MGELPAFLIGWALLAEYVFLTSAVARGWSGYLESITRVLGVPLPGVFVRKCSRHLKSNDNKKWHPFFIGKIFLLKKIPSY